MRAMRIVGMTALIAALAACSGNKGLRTLNSSKDGPDEFRVLPVKPLQEPTSFTALPVPTPGGVNRTDPNPNADAVAALGGRPAALQAGDRIPSADGALVRQAGRYGVTPNIRGELAAADADFRRRQARWTQLRIVPVDRYQQAYRSEALDPYAEAARFRRAGIPTPAAPPEGGS